MPFDEVPGWVMWLAQDADGAWHPQGVGRGCKAAEAATATLWGYEAEPNKQDRGWYRGLFTLISCLRCRDKAMDARRDAQARAIPCQAA